MANVDPKAYERSFFSSLEDIALICDWLEKLLTELSISSTKVFHSQLCVQEILSNIYEYGCPYYEDNQGQGSTTSHVCKITLTVKLSSDRLIIIIVDDSRPYNLLETKIKLIDKKLETAVPGGHGIRLIKKYADNINYCYKNNENQITLEFIL